MSLTFEQAVDRLKFLVTNTIKDALTLGLSDDLGAKVVHLDSSIPQFLNLSIANTLSSEVNILKLPKDQPSPNNYHFHIKFVNNQCFFNSPTLATPKWLMKVVPEKGFVTDIYLQSTEPITLAAASSETHTIGIRLMYSNASLKNVAVGNLKAAVTVGENIKAVVPPEDESLTGTTTVELTTFTDSSAPTPLIATLVQPKTILNDGTPSSLLLRVVNTSPEPIGFAPPPGRSSSTPTAIELTIDIDDTAAWALCKPDASDLITVDRPLNWDGSPKGERGTTQKRWIFRPKYDQTTKIDPHSALEFSINGLKTTLPPGFANLYVTFWEFPIYGTQTVVQQIEKSPMIYNPELGTGLVSKGTTGANHGLALNGGTTGEMLLVDQSGDGNSAHFKGGAGVNIENGLVVSGDTRLNDGVLWLRKSPDNNNGIGVYGGTNNKRTAFAGQSVEGPVVFGLKGGALGSTDGGEKAALSWKSTGKVGVGTSEPKSTLSVKGGMAVGSTYADTQEAPANNLLVEGNVGAGTKSPSAMLQIGDSSLKDKIFGDITTVGIVQRATDSVGLSLRRFDGNPVMQFSLYDKDGKNELGNYIQAEKDTGDILIGNTDKARVSTAGKVTTPGLAVNGSLTISGKDKAKNALELGLDYPKKEPSAGKLAYAVWSDGLDIVGAGESAGQRQVCVWDNLSLMSGGNDRVRNVMEFGYGYPKKQQDAGKIGYKAFSDGLDIVGAGSTGQTRQVHLWDDVYVHGQLWLISGGGWCRFEPQMAVGQGSWQWVLLRSLSDARLKKNVTPIESPLDRVRKLNGCNFDWTDEALNLFTKDIDTAEREKQHKLLNRPRVGVIAQEVEAVLPEAVTTGEEGYKSVSYPELVALLVESVKEQDRIVSAQAELLARMQAEIQQLKQALLKAVPQTA